MTTTKAKAIDKEEARPKANDWNNYWSLEQTQKFTKVSWSKKRIMRMLQPYVGPNKHALDAGCGSGFFSQFFCEHGMATTALDYSQAALDIAQEKTGGRARLVKANLVEDKLSRLTKEKFDLIFSDGLLEHFSPVDQDKIITNLSSVLSPEGVLVTFVPNRWSPWELIRPFFMPGIEEDPFVLSQLIDLNERNGLKPLTSGGLNTVPFAFSPDGLFGSMWGMLLYTISKKR